MSKLTNRILILFVTIILLWLAACSDRPGASTASSGGPTPATTPATAQSAVASNTAKGVTFTAAPNPIKVCDGSGLGITTLTWNAPGVGMTEIHVGAPDGPLFNRSTIDGSATTGKWVTNATVFYLQDVSDRAKPTAVNTIGTLTVNLTMAGCP